MIRFEAAADAPAVVGGLTHGELRAAIDAAAASFLPLAGKVVALAEPEGVGQAIAILGALQAGCLALPLPPGAAEAERGVLLSAAALLEPGKAPGEAGACLLVPTSGSTSAPRLIPLRPQGLVWNARAHAAALGLPPGVRTLVNSPLAHAFPFVALVLATWLRGGAVAWQEGTFSPRGFLRQVARDGIQYAALPPPLLRLLVARVPEPQGLPDVLSVGAAPVTPEELRAWEAWSGGRLYHTYGLTEAGPRVATLAPADVAAKAHTVGRLLPGIEARTDEQGQLWLRSPSQAGAGWLPTGDLGQLEDGFLVIKGRLKDVILCGGLTIWAREVEDALLADARVGEAVVVARPEQAYGEVPVAFVTLNAPATAQELLAALTERLGRPKLPHRIVIREELPRTGLGKPDRRRLREDACAGVAIAATGAHLPEEILDNAALIERCGLPVSPRWIERHTGIRQRHWAGPEEFTSTLAIRCGRNILHAAHADPLAVQRLILATVSPDWPTPATACVVQDGLGARCPAFDVTSACAGFMVALDLGIRCVQTGEDDVLVLASEVRSRWIDQGDARVAPLFSDGAGGVLLKPCREGEGFLASVLQSDGSGAEKVLVPAGGARRPADARSVADGAHFIRMLDGRGIFEQAVTGMQAIAELALQRAGLTLADVDLVVPHQANKGIIEAGMKAMGVPMDRVVVTIDHIGNCTAATVPISLHEASVAGLLQPGMTVLLMAVGGGYSAGAAIYRVPLEGGPWI